MKKQVDHTGWQYIRDYKLQAKTMLKERLKELLPIFAVYFVVCIVVREVYIIGNMLEKHGLISNTTELIFELISIMLQFLITSVLWFGISVISIKTLLAKPIDRHDLFLGFRHCYGKLLWLYFSDCMLLLLWSLLLIVPCVIKSYSYSMTLFILVENPSMTVSEARRESIRMMKGHKWELFKLELSFIGWTVWFNVILWVTHISFYSLIDPYRQTTRVLFYQSIKDYKSPKGKLTVAAWE